MRTFRVCGLTVRAHPALIAMLALCALSGDGARLVMMLAALLLHETAHILCARRLGVRVLELELMPFGGAARLENAWAMRPGQLALVALAGPAANALVCALFLALGRRGLVAPRAAWHMVVDNGALCLFNLLPALPLDGGRIVFGLLSGPVGAERAARWGVWAGRILAGLLLAAVVWGALLLGRVSLTPALCAAFLLAAGARERLAAGSAGLMSFMKRKAELRDEGTLPIRWLAAPDDARLNSLIPRLRPRALHRIAVYDADMRLAGVVEEEALLDALLVDANAALGALVERGAKTPARVRGA